MRKSPRDNNTVKIRSTVGLFIIIYNIIIDQDLYILKTAYLFANEHSIIVHIQNYII